MSGDRSLDVEALAAQLVALVLVGAVSVGVALPVVPSAAGVTLLRLLAEFEYAARLDLVGVAAALGDEPAVALAERVVALDVQALSAWSPATVVRLAAAARGRHRVVRRAA